MIGSSLESGERIARLTTLNYSPPLKATRLRHASQNVWQTDISTWTRADHLELNLDMTQLLLVPGKHCPHMDLSATVEDIAVSPSPTARTVGVVCDNQLGCTAIIPSYRFPLLRRDPCWGRASSLPHPADVVERRPFLNRDLSSTGPSSTGICSAPASFFVVNGEWLNLAIVSALHLFLSTSLLYRIHIVVSLSSDKCTYCKSLWIKTSAKCPECICLWDRHGRCVSCGWDFLPGCPSVLWESFWGVHWTGCLSPGNTIMQNCHQKKDVAWRNTKGC